MNVFITGGTGFVGRRLIEELIKRGHTVDALVRPGSEKKLAAGANLIAGNPLDASTYKEHLRSDHTFVQLVGAHHPKPWDDSAFEKIDFTSGKEAVEAARLARVEHFVYVSVAQPAPFMQSYIQVRADIEARVRSSGLKATILRPWYVIGPGRRWPLLFKPLYWILESQAATRNDAQRLGFISIDQFVHTLVLAVENPPPGVEVLEVPEMRR